MDTTPADADAEMTSPSVSAAPESTTHATLSSPPRAGQIVAHDGRLYGTVKEGLAYILTPDGGASSSPAGAKKKKQKQRKGGAGDGNEGEDGDGSAQPGQSVFYNPIQQFNRDLSVLAIRVYAEHAVEVKRGKAERARAAKVKAGDRDGAGRGRKRKRGDGEGEGEGEGKEEAEVEEVAVAKSEDAAVEEPKKTQTPTFSILDALSATGLRALRYAKEIPTTTRVVANDLSPDAIASMHLNISHNDVADIVHPNKGDACAYMYSLLGAHKHSKDTPHTGKFDVVDLDPYGTAAPFMDAAIQAVVDGGLLCVTCTDAGIFASNGYPEKTYALYGGAPFKGSPSHEAGLRLILHALATAGAKYGIAIEPLLSLSIDFYARVFVRVHRSPAAVKFTAGKTMVVYNCDSGCGAWKTQLLAATKSRSDRKGNPLYHYGLAQGPSAGVTCEHCGFKTHLAGPMWAGPLHNGQFIRRVLALLDGGEGVDAETYPTWGRMEGMLRTALEEDLDFGADTETAAGPDTGTATGTAEQTTPAPTSPPVSAIIPRTPPAAVDPHPFFFMPSYLCKVLHTQTIPEDSLRGALAHLGYRSTRSHTQPGSIRTDAPWDVIWEVIREWVRQRCPVKEGAIRPGTAGEGVMRRARERMGVAEGEGEGKGEGADLRALKREVLKAVEGGRDVGELVMRIEAALYRAGRGVGVATSMSTTAAETTTTTTPTTQDPNNPPTNGTTNQPTPTKTATATAEQSRASRRAAARRAARHSASPSAPEKEARIDPSSINVVFDEALGRSVMGKKRLIRYQMNPRANWGPMNRAGRKG
ncbi:RNA methyltransferase tRNA(m5U54)methyltransferase [Onygenales sp. PD_40]|nr:RNA methyltransferase tRNA(m5U54)methyltransferase [Onygenales sp. PD_40]